MWSAAGDVDPPEDNATSVEVAPGRTWRFVAAVASDDVIEQGHLRWFDVPATEPTWSALANADVALTREADGISLMIFVETEHSSVELAKHPLVVEFVAEMKTALDACAAV